MERVLKSTPATISAVWYDDEGVLVDPGAVTVRVERENGTELVAQIAAAGEGAAPRTFALTADHTAQLDMLKATWSSATHGERTTYVEVVGGFFFTVFEARKLSPLGDPETYPGADIAAARTAAEQAIENACEAAGIAFVPRYRRETHRRVGEGTTLELHRARPLRLRKVTVDGTDLTGDQLATISLDPAGALEWPDEWTLDSTVEVTYEHGYPTPPRRVALAALKYARSLLVDRLVDDRTHRVNVEGGSIVFATGDGAEFDLPELNAIVERYGKPRPVRLR